MSGALHDFQLGVDPIKSFVAVHKVAAFGRLPAFFNLLANLVFVQREDFISLLEKLESFTKNVTCGVISAGFQSGLDELLKVWSEMYVHLGASTVPS